MSHSNSVSLACPADHLVVRITVPGLPALHDALWLPFKSGRHPDTDTIFPEHVDWLREHGLLDDRNAGVFERARFHELAGRVYHRQDREALRLAADFIAALFVLDDLLDTAADPACRDADQARTQVDVVRRAAHSGRAPTRRASGIDAIASGVADLTRRLQRRGVATDGYLRELDVYLDGVIEETRRRRQGYTSVADYASVRVAFSAVYACIELGLALSGGSLLRPLRPLAHAANLSVSWVNDVFSWPKERALGEGSNLIAVLAEQHRWSESRAFHEACRACDRVVLDYQSARVAFLGDDCEAVHLMESWMRGNYDWHALATARYLEHLSVAPSWENGGASRFGSKAHGAVA